MEESKDTSLQRESAGGGVSHALHQKASLTPPRVPLSPHRNRKKQQPLSLVQTPSRVPLVPPSVQPGSNGSGAGSLPLGINNTITLSVGSPAVPDTETAAATPPILTLPPHNQGFKSRESDACHSAAGSSACGSPPPIVVPAAKRASAAEAAACPPPTASPQAAGLSPDDSFPAHEPNATNNPSSPSLCDASKPRVQPPTPGSRSVLSLLSTSASKPLKQLRLLSSCLNTLSTSAATDRPADQRSLLCLRRPPKLVVGADEDEAQDLGGIDDRKEEYAAPRPSWSGLLPLREAAAVGDAVLRFLLESAVRASGGESSGAPSRRQSLRHLRFLSETGARPSNSMLDLLAAGSRSGSPGAAQESKPPSSNPLSLPPTPMQAGRYPRLKLLKRSAEPKQCPLLFRLAGLANDKRPPLDSSREAADDAAFLPRLRYLQADGRGCPALCFLLNNLPKRRKAQRARMAAPLDAEKPAPPASADGELAAESSVECTPRKFKFGSAASELPEAAESGRLGGEDDSRPAENQVSSSSWWPGRIGTRESLASTDDAVLQVLKDLGDEPAYVDASSSNATESRRFSGTSMGLKSDSRTSATDPPFQRVYSEWTGGGLSKQHRHSRRKRKSRDYSSGNVNNWQSFDNQPWDMIRPASEASIAEHDPWDVVRPIDMTALQENEPWDLVHSSDEIGAVVSGFFAEDARLPAGYQGLPVLEAAALSIINEKPLPGLVILKQSVVSSEYAHALRMAPVETSSWANHPFDQTVETEDDKSDANHSAAPPDSARTNIIAAVPLEPVRHNPPYSADACTLSTATIAVATCILVNQLRTAATRKHAREAACGAAIAAVVAGSDGAWQLKSEEAPASPDAAHIDTVSSHKTISDTENSTGGAGTTDAAYAAVFAVVAASVDKPESGSPTGTPRTDHLDDHAAEDAKAATEAASSGFAISEVSVDSRSGKGLSIILNASPGPVLDSAVTEDPTQREADAHPVPASRKPSVGTECLAQEATLQEPVASANEPAVKPSESIGSLLLETVPAEPLASAIEPQANSETTAGEGRVSRRESGSELPPLSVHPEVPLPPKQASTPVVGDVENEMRSKTEGSAADADGRAQTARDERDAVVPRKEPEPTSKPQKPSSMSAATSARKRATPPHLLAFGTQPTKEASEAKAPGLRALRDSCADGGSSLCYVRALIGLGEDVHTDSIRLPEKRDPSLGGGNAGRRSVSPKTPSTPGYEAGIVLKGLRAITTDANPYVLALCQLCSSTAPNSPLSPSTSVNFSFPRSPALSHEVFCPHLNTPPFSLSDTSHLKFPGLTVLALSQPPPADPAMEFLIRCLAATVGDKSDVFSPISCSPASADAGSPAYSASNKAPFLLGTPGLALGAAKEKAAAEATKKTRDRGGRPPSPCLSLPPPSCVSLDMSPPSPDSLFLSPGGEVGPAPILLISQPAPGHTPDHLDPEWAGLSEYDPQGPLPAEASTGLYLIASVLQDEGDASLPVVSLLLDAYQPSSRTSLASGDGGASPSCAPQPPLLGELSSPPPLAGLLYLKDSIPPESLARRNHLAMLFDGCQRRSSGDVSNAHSDKVRACAPGAEGDALAQERRRIFADDSMQLSSSLTTVLNDLADHSDHDKALDGSIKKMPSLVSIADAAGLRLLALSLSADHLPRKKHLCMLLDTWQHPEDSVKGNSECPAAALQGRDTRVTASQPPQATARVAPPQQQHAAKPAAAASHLADHHLLSFLAESIPLGKCTYLRVLQKTCRNASLPAIAPAAAGQQARDAHSQRPAAAALPPAAAGNQPKPARDVDSPRRAVALPPAFVGSGRGNGPKPGANARVETAPSALPASDSLVSVAGTKSKRAQNMTQIDRLSPGLALLTGSLLSERPTHSGYLCLLLETCRADAAAASLVSGEASPPTTTTTSPGNDVLSLTETASNQQNTTGQVPCSETGKMDTCAFVPSRVVHPFSPQQQFSAQFEHDNPKAMPQTEDSMQSIRTDSLSMQPAKDSIIKPRQDVPYEWLLLLSELLVPSQEHFKLLLDSRHRLITTQDNAKAISFSTAVPHEIPSQRAATPHTQTAPVLPVDSVSAAPEFDGVSDLLFNRPKKPILPSSLRCVRPQPVSGLQVLIDAAEPHSCCYLDALLRVGREMDEGTKRGLPAEQTFSETRLPDDEAQRNNASADVTEVWTLDDRPHCADADFELRGAPCRDISMAVPTGQLRLSGRSSGLHHVSAMAECSAEPVPSLAFLAGRSPSPPPPAVGAKCHALPLALPEAVVALAAVAYSAAWSGRLQCLHQRASLVQKWYRARLAAAHTAAAAREQADAVDSSARFIQSWYRDRRASGGASPVASTPTAQQTTPVSSSQSGNDEAARFAPALAIQKHVRGFIARKRFGLALLNQKTRQQDADRSASARTVQKHVRGFIARKRFGRALLDEKAQRQLSARRLQAAGRGLAGRSASFSSHAGCAARRFASARAVQKHVRGFIARKRFGLALLDNQQTRQQMLVRRLQAAGRGLAGRRACFSLCSARSSAARFASACMVQKHVRGLFARKSFRRALCDRRLHEASVWRLQAAGRGRTHRAALSDEKTRHASAVLVQKHVRGHLARDGFAQNRAKENAALHPPAPQSSRTPDQPDQPASNEPQATPAARTVQRCGRGLFARGVASRAWTEDRLRKTRLSESRVQGAKREAPAATGPDRHASALRIQKLFRGQLARKNVLWANAMRAMLSMELAVGHLHNKMLEGALKRKQAGAVSAVSAALALATLAYATRGQQGGEAAEHLVNGGVLGREMAGRRPHDSDKEKDDSETEYFTPHSRRMSSPLQQHRQAEPPKRTCRISAAKHVPETAPPAVSWNPAGEAGRRPQDRKSTAAAPPESPAGPQPMNGSGEACREPTGKSPAATQTPPAASGDAQRRRRTSSAASARSGGQGKDKDKDKDKEMGKGKGGRQAARGPSPLKNQPRHSPSSRRPSQVSAQGGGGNGGRADSIQTDPRTPPPPQAAAGASPPETKKRPNLLPRPASVTWEDEDVFTPHKLVESPRPAGCSLSKESLDGQAIAANVWDADSTASDDLVFDEVDGSFGPALRPSYEPGKVKYSEDGRWPFFPIAGPSVQMDGNSASPQSQKTPTRRAGSPDKHVWETPSESPTRQKRALQPRSVFRTETTGSSHVRRVLSRRLHSGPLLKRSPTRTAAHAAPAASRPQTVTHEALAILSPLPHRREMTLPASVPRNIRDLHRAAARPAALPGAGPPTPLRKPLFSPASSRPESQLRMYARDFADCELAGGFPPVVQSPSEFGPAVPSSPTGSDAFTRLAPESGRSRKGDQSAFFSSTSTGDAAPHGPPNRNNDKGEPREHKPLRKRKLQNHSLAADARLEAALPEAGVPQLLRSMNSRGPLHGTPADSDKAYRAFFPEEVQTPRLQRALSTQRTASRAAPSSGTSAASPNLPLYPEFLETLRHAVGRNRSKPRSQHRTPPDVLLGLNKRAFQSHTLA
eukprot:gene14581-22304_t